MSYTSLKTRYSKLYSRLNYTTKSAERDNIEASLILPSFIGIASLIRM
ncbi:MAG: hypothetical protein KME18_23175 [Phormidium tanganyikae FI6-MK23]|nr:hypothetical protein [Phormidium tanganyikae FI6-MK23]